jgi:hypothetical protein
MKLGVGRALPAEYRNQCEEMIGGDVRPTFSEMLLRRICVACKIQACPRRGRAARAGIFTLENAIAAPPRIAAAAWFTQLEAKARDCIDYLPAAAAAVKRSTKKEE